MVLLVSAIADAVSEVEVEVAYITTDSFRGRGVRGNGGLDVVVSGEYRGGASVRHATVEGEEIAEAIGSILTGKTYEYVYFVTVLGCQ